MRLAQNPIEVLMEFTRKLNAEFVLNVFSCDFSDFHVQLAQEHMIEKGDIMDTQTLRDHCSKLKGAQETFPFTETALVFKVMDKMFAIVPLDIPSGEPATISLKCDPELAQILRQTYPAVQPGYHLSKKHWNTVTCDGTIPDDEIFGWIEDSYELIVKGLSRKAREQLAAM